MIAASEGQSPAAINRAEKGASQPMIAIIDDDEDVRVATENLVLSYGLEARTFASAEEFLDSPDVNEADCLITDMQMPGMSGVDLQVELRKRGCDVPMVFITAFPQERLRRQVESLGALGFLTKPFDTRSLMACVDAALARTGHRRI
jgi:FixJ family two-component response regulator